jgi:type III secretion HrpO family protein
VGTTYILDYANKAMLLMLMLSLPPIVVATAVGLLVSLFQALTQIQEQTLAFAVKLVAVILTLAAVTTWIGAELYRLAVEIFERFPLLVR